jgi:hypothetical protein
MATEWQEGHVAPQAARRGTQGAAFLSPVSCVLWLWLLANGEVAKPRLPSHKPQATSQSQRPHGYEDKRYATDMRVSCGGVCVAWWRLELFFLAARKPPKAKYKYEPRRGRALVFRNSRISLSAGCRACLEPAAKPAMPGVFLRTHHTRHQHCFLLFGFCLLWPMAFLAPRCSMQSAIRVDHNQPLIPYNRVQPDAVCTSRLYLLSSHHAPDCRSPRCMGAAVAAALRRHIASMPAHTTTLVTLR